MTTLSFIIGSSFMDFVASLISYESNHPNGCRLQNHKCHNSTRSTLLEWLIFVVFIFSELYCKSRRQVVMKRSLKVKGHKSEFSESNNKEMKNQAKTIMMKLGERSEQSFFGHFCESPGLPGSRFNLLIPFYS